MVEIIPAILAKTPEEFSSMLKKTEPYTAKVHVDVADGVFVPNKTVDGIDEIKEAHTSLQITAHLMISKPENCLEQWLDTDVEALIFHVESTDQMEKLINETNARGKRVGIAINPDTSLDDILPFVEKCDFIHFLTVDPGFYGGEFKKEVLDKIRRFKKKYGKIEVRVDGGINPDTAKKAAEAGADVLIAGSYFFKQGLGINDAMENLKKAVIQF